jgi:methylmalonyl-CoA carboxyltransferase large subunit
MAKITMKSLAETLEQVQAQLAALSERMAQLEAGEAKQPPAEAEPAAPLIREMPAPIPAKPEITEEELLAISAALGAYLGVRVHIRHIRLLSSRAWSQQGRVSIQASHNVHN